MLKDMLWLNIKNIMKLKIVQKVNILSENLF